MVEDITKFRKNTVKMNKIEIMNRERIFKPSQEKTEFLEIDLTKKKQGGSNDRHIITTKN